MAPGVKAAFERADLFNLEPYAGYLASRRNPTTAKGYQDKLRWLHLYLTTRGLAFSEIRGKHLVDFMTWMKTKYSARSLMVLMYAVSGLFKFMVMTEQLDRDPSRVLTTLGYRQPKPNPRPLDRAIEEKLLMSLRWSTFEDSRQSLVVLLGLHEGLRRAEICGIKWADLDFDGGLLVDGKWVATGMVRVTGKGDKTRRLPMTLSVRTALNEFLIRYKMHFHGLFVDDCRNEYLFRSSRVYVRGDLVPGHSGIERLFWLAKARARLNQEPFTLHSLRHTYLTRLVEAGANAYEVRDLAGHESIETSESYVRVTERAGHLAHMRTFEKKVVGV